MTYTFFSEKQLDNIYQRFQKIILFNTIIVLLATDSKEIKTVEC